MAPIWRQAISWSNDGKNLCCLEVTVDNYELRAGMGVKRVIFELNGITKQVWYHIKGHEKLI